MAAVLSPAMYEELAAVARAAQAAGHGGKTKVYQAAADRMGCSKQTLLQRLKQVRVGAPRKRRADAGRCALTRSEALLIAATVEETRRLTGTGELPLEEAVRILRSNGKILAGQVDKETGEYAPLSVSAIRRALTHYNCHPAQLAQPSAAVELASEHPNHYWQIDASISRQFYLADSGTEVMPRAVYYRGKPKNFESINDRRLIRYDVVDHCTGHIRLFYVLRAESALNVVSALIHAMTPAEGIAMHGVPRILGLDLGSTSATVQNFCDALGVELRPHAQGNARALGSAERGHDLIETLFEAALKLRAPVVSIEEINRHAEQWCRAFNATRVHTRTRVTRRDGWLRITPQQLTLAPAPQVLRELAMSTPKTCIVRNLVIKFNGQRWDVSAMPGVLNGAKLSVALNAYDPKSVRVLTTGDDGRASHYLAPRIETNEWGFSAGAARVGEEYKSMPDTPADTVRKEIGRLAMQVDTDEAAKAARKAKRVAFGGDVDATQPWREANVPAALPRAGAPTTVQTPEIVEPTAHLPTILPQYPAQALSHEDMARALKRRVEALGGTWSPALYAQMAQRWPDGVTEEQLDGCATALLRGGLRVVGGAA
jgi:hypothetical protein